MLNPNLKLNPKIFDKDVEQKATREGFGDALVRIGKENPNIVVLTADLAESTKVEGFEKEFPERFFEIGVAEQNMAAIAAGFGVTGKIPFISSYATFSPGKNLETIRTTIVYNNANVKVAGHHSGVMTGADGATHQATEDIAIMRAMPNTTIFVPCDSIEAEKATVEASKINGPVYLRFTREKTPVITTPETPFSDKVETYWENESPKVTIFATGYLLFYALLAAKVLEEKGIEVLVANVSKIKPIDQDSIIKLSQRSGKVITVEDHQVMGGLGGLIAETLSKSSPTPMEFIGLQDTFAESGKPVDLLRKYKMDDVAIIEAVERMLSK